MIRHLSPRTIERHGGLRGSYRLYSDLQISQIKNGLEKLARIKSQVIKIVVNGLDVPLLTE